MDLSNEIHSMYNTGADRILMTCAFIFMVFFYVIVFLNFKLNHNRNK
jgi:hypothetical protein